MFVGIPFGAVLPRAELLKLPSGYGRSRNKLAWSEVRQQLEDAMQYWLATARSDGRPHVVPLDGLWVDDVWYYGGGDDALHRRIVRQNARAVMHLPDPMRAVIVEGEVQHTTASPELAQRLAETSNVKYAAYGHHNDASAYAEVLALQPRRVIAWTSFPRDATRFLFAPDNDR